MKKFFLMLAVSMMTASAFAQNTAITSNKAEDNWYVGVNAGVATPLAKYGDYGFFKGFAPSFGVRVGKNLTTVFGLALDANMYFESSEKSLLKQKTFVDAINVDIMGTFNLSNAFGTYTGEPRPFEVIGLIGGGYSRSFGAKAAGVNAKAALDFAFNLGAAKAVQVYIEPALVLGQPYVQWANPLRKNAPGDKWNGVLQLSAGINYKFGNSNGTHNYKIAELRDQSEIDALNAKINELRSDVDAKNGKIASDAQVIADLKKKLADCEARPTTAAVVEKTVNETVLQPIVIFRQGKSTIDAAQYASVEMVAKYMKNHPNAKVLVKGYASPEGNAELNQKLSEARATSVANALIKRYKISKDRITTQGLGATSEISEENDFNRVAMFVDTTK